MATKKTATKETTSPVKLLGTRFRVTFGQDIDDYLDDYYYFWLDKDGDVRVEDLYFGSTEQAAKILRNMADFLESYNKAK